MNTVTVDKFLVAAELEDPNCPAEVAQEFCNNPRFTKENWDLLREYGLVGSGYVHTEAQTLAFCFAAAIAENPPKGK